MESLVIESVTGLSRWQPFNDGIYFIQRDPKLIPPRERIQFFDFGTGKTSLLAELGKRGSLYGGFSVSPDHRHLIVAQIDQDDSDILLVENFR